MAILWSNVRKIHLGLSTDDKTFITEEGAKIYYTDTKKIQIYDKNVGWIDYVEQITHSTSASTNNGINYRRLSTADTNLAVIKASAGRITLLTVSNLVASARFVKLYNKATNPTLASDIPVFTFPIPANQTISFVNNDIGAYFSNGIAIAITGAIADIDATAIAANDIVINAVYA